MKPVKDETNDVLESAAVEGAKRMMAYFAYQGSEPSYYNKAKIGAAACSGFTRMRASETNRIAVEAQIAREAKK
jgi:hypothetical protein